MIGPETQDHEDSICLLLSDEAEVGETRNSTHFRRREDEQAYGWANQGRWSGEKAEEEEQHLLSA